MLVAGVVFNNLANFSINYPQSLGPSPHSHAVAQGDSGDEEETNLSEVPPGTPRSTVSRGKTQTQDEGKYFCVPWEWPRTQKAKHFV